MKIIIKSIQMSYDALILISIMILVMT